MFKKYLMIAGVFACCFAITTNAIHINFVSRTTLQSSGHRETKVVSKDDTGTETGYIVYILNPAAKTAIIKELFVVPTMRSLNIGTHLVRKALKAMLDSGYKDIQVLGEPHEVELESPERATAIQKLKKFYEKSGFVFTKNDYTNGKVSGVWMRYEPFVLKRIDKHGQNYVKISAYDAGVPVGYIDYSTTRKKCSFIKIEVYKPFRYKKGNPYNKHYGSLLLKRALDDMINTVGCTTIKIFAEPFEIGLGMPGRDEALQKLVDFYTKNGFKETDRDMLGDTVIGVWMHYPNLKPQGKEKKAVDASKKKEFKTNVSRSGTV